MAVQVYVVAALMASASALIAPMKKPDGTVDLESVHTHILLLEQMFASLAKASEVETLKSKVRTLKSETRRQIQAVNATVVETRSAVQEANVYNMAEPEDVSLENVNPVQQNQGTAGELQRCADDLHEKHQCNRCCDIIFRLIGGIGNVLVIVAFAFLFHEEDFKKSDYVAICGAAISLLANIGKLVADRKRSYDNRRCIKNNVLPVVPARRVVLDEITLMSLQPEDSALSFLTMYCRCVCCRPLCCGCCCQEPCLSDDPLEPLCMTNPCRCLCCQCPCSCGGARCQMCCSFFTFLLTFEFFESTFNIVSSGWVLSSNVKAISGRIPTNASSKYFEDLTGANQVGESFDVLLAIIPLLFSLIIIIWTCRKCCKGTDERPVVQIRHLSDNIRQ